MWSLCHGSAGWSGPAGEWGYCLGSCPWIAGLQEVATASQCSPGCLSLGRTPSACRMTTERETLLRPRWHCLPAHHRGCPRMKTGMCYPHMPLILCLHCHPQCHYAQQTDPNHGTPALSAGNTFSDLFSVFASTPMPFPLCPPYSKATSEESFHGSWGSLFHIPWLEPQRVAKAITTSSSPLLPPPS